MYLYTRLCIIICMRVDFFKSLSGNLKIVIKVNVPEI